MNAEQYLQAKRLGDPSLYGEEFVNAVYAERQMLLALLTRLIYQSGIGYAWLGEDREGEEGWRTVLFISLEGKQMTWHLHDSELFMFAHVLREPETDQTRYDGHTTLEKYQRLLEYTERGY